MVSSRVAHLRHLHAVAHSAYPASEASHKVVKYVSTVRIPRCVSVCPNGARLQL